jgi:hypothetical protein
MYEKLRRKDIYIVSAVLILIFVIASGGAANVNVSGESVTSYSKMTPFLMTLMSGAASALAIMLSIGTIPNEYVRNTSHLVWVRGVSQPRYHAGLALGSALSSIASLLILSFGFIIVMVRKGGAADIPKLPAALLFCLLPVFIISFLASVLSIVVSPLISGFIALFVGLIGYLRPAFLFIANMMGGRAGRLISAVCKVVPDLYGMQNQGSRFLHGESIQWHIVLGGLLMLFIVCHGLLLFKRKEA